MDRKDLRVLYLMIEADAQPGVGEHGVIDPRAKPWENMSPAIIAVRGAWRRRKLIEAAQTEAGGVPGLWIVTKAIKRAEIGEYMITTTEVEAARVALFENGNVKEGLSALRARIDLTASIARRTSEVYALQILEAARRAKARAAKARAAEVTR